MHRLLDRAKEERQREKESTHERENEKDGNDEKMRKNDAVALHGGSQLDA
jgi:hypothetical protein